MTKKAEVFSKGDLSEKEIKLALKLIEFNKDQMRKRILNFAKGKRSKPLQLKLK